MRAFARIKPENRRFFVFPQVPVFMVIWGEVGRLFFERNRDFGFGDWSIQEARGNNCREITIKEFAQLINIDAKKIPLVIPNGGTRL